MVNNYFTLLFLLLKGGIGNLKVLAILQIKNDLLSRMVSFFFCFGTRIKTCLGNVPNMSQMRLESLNGLILGIFTFSNRYNISGFYQFVNLTNCGFDR